MGRCLVERSSCGRIPASRFHLGLGILQAAFAGGRRRALRARSPIHRARNPVRFDTRHNSFGVKPGQFQLRREPVAAATRRRERMRRPRRIFRTHDSVGFEPPASGASPLQRVAATVFVAADELNHSGCWDAPFFWQPPQEPTC